MTATASSPMDHDADHEQIIAAISNQLSVPFQKVSEIYWEQLMLLQAGARIRSFLSVLASGKTRSILRSNGTHDNAKST